jgi:formylglycine-generating enzyme required for sulfatase activity
MGDTFGDGQSDEKPVHEVCVDDFYLGKYEVTVGQFRRFSEATGYRTDSERNTGGKSGCYAWKNGSWGWQSGYLWDSPDFTQKENQPVACVSWNDVKAFIDWVNSKSAERTRLPSEAEWEYAARGGTRSARYWGDDPDRACGYANVTDRTAGPGNHSWSNKHDCTDDYWFSAPVGNYKPNPLGLYDMLGNVWEWCGDWYGDEYYAQSPRNNPQGPELGLGRVARGGSWYDGPGVVRSANRLRGSPDYRRLNLGFRLAFPAVR